ncbi:MAG: cytochrome c [Planctomycetes bacterium]|nr:cytochrome c [Planctomycetota bacterium]
MHNKLLLLPALLAALAALAACGDSAANKTNTAPRAPVVLRKAVPADFKGKTNPTPDAKADGEALFKTHCVSCHGDKGDGDSPTGKALNPPAADLTAAAFHDAVGDDYIFWRITTGAAGGPAGSGMTPFNNLGEDQRWQIVAFVRSLKK